VDEKNPALRASRESWRCVQGGLKDEWLGLMADDVVVEDPIGVSMLDPDGLGHRGKAAVSAFWDKNIGPNRIEVEVHESFTAGSEVAHLMTLRTTMPSAGQRAVVRGVFTYRVNDGGLIVALRGFWDMSDLRMEPVEGAS
jgi:steroid delta-isomerase